MITPDIQSMTPETILVKEAFTRLVPSRSLTAGGVTYRTGRGIPRADYDDDPLCRMAYPQSEFLRELDPHAHKINSLQYYANPFTMDETGKIYRKIKSRVALAFQRIILDQRVVMLTGNNVSLTLLDHRGGDAERERLATFQEGWQTLSVENAVKEFIEADFSVGDAALCFHMRGGRGGWRLLSYTRGDILYPHFDPETGELALLGRRFSVRDSGDEEVTEYLEVWDRTSFMRYRQDKKGPRGAAVGLNGWVVDTPPAPHGFPDIPVVYDRYGGPCWAGSQDSIDKLEMSLSLLMENNNSYALRILYAFGADMKVIPSADGTPSQIHSQSENARVGFLEPADSSSSFEVQLRWLKENIYKASSVVERPEIKSGADISSLTVKMMYADAYYKAQLDAMHFQPALDRIVERVKHIWGIQGSRPSDMDGFRVKAEITPFIFLSDTESVSNIQQLRAAGALSKRTAAQRAYEMGIAGINEADVVRQEEHDDLLGEASAQGRAARNPVNESRES